MGVVIYIEGTYYEIVFVDDNASFFILIECKVEHLNKWG